MSRSLAARCLLTVPLMIRQAFALAVRLRVRFPCLRFFWRWSRLALAGSWSSLAGLAGARQGAVFKICWILSLKGADAELADASGSLTISCRLGGLAGAAATGSLTISWWLGGPSSTSPSARLTGLSVELWLWLLLRLRGEEDLVGACAGDSRRRFAVFAACAAQTTQWPGESLWIYSAPRHHARGPIGSIWI
jgi:hypothetical protein